MSNLPSIRAGREALRRDALVQTGREVLLAGQAPSGALIASPNFPVYRFAWLRDGAFCAQALSLVGEHAAASDFHLWAARTIVAHRDLAARSARAAQLGEERPPYLPTRYTLDGELEPDLESWPNFQLDGYGIWLHAVVEHSEGEALGGGHALPPEITEAVRLTADYLRATWNLACNDCWEEPGDGRHTSTLLAVAAGLRAAARALRDADLDASADEVTARILDRHLHAGRLTKSASDLRVDASLLWLGTSFDLEVPARDALTSATVEAVAGDLRVPGAGVRRYLGDSYFGGGQWLLLTSWLGWHAARSGDRATSEQAEAWVRAQADAAGHLPEQVTLDPQFPEMIQKWIGSWGQVAQPLLWSHAMQIIHAAAVVDAGWPAHE